MLLHPFTLVWCSAQPPCISFGKQSRRPSNNTRLLVLFFLLQWFHVYFWCTRIVWWHRFPNDFCDDQMMTARDLLLWKSSLRATAGWHLAESDLCFRTLKILHVGKRSHVSTQPTVHIVELPIYVNRAAERSRATKQAARGHRRHGSQECPKAPPPL